jgi:beta-glucuronidase
MIFTHGREGLDLNGTWKFNPDPMQRCRQQQWWKNLASDKSFFPCWNIEGLWDIQVPSTWKTEFEELKWYDGHANYVRDFEMPQIPEDREAFLVFDGIVYASEVYLNGQKIGGQDWGYAPFACRVTEVLRPQNRLFVLVENILKADRVPGVRFDWNNDGGIINAVKLVFVPKIYVENFRTSTRLEKNEAIIEVEAFLQSRDRSVQEEVTLSIPALNRSVSFFARVNEKACAQIRVPLCEIELWCPENPKLYRTELSTRHETLTDEIGYREIKTRGREILLNGRSIRLNGLCIHSEFKDTGRTATPNGIEQMLEKARELGVNFLRCAHYPYAEIFGRAMDRAGMLWWEEVPVYWLPTIHHESMTRLALGMMRQTIQRDWNRASLIFWSISNECAGDAGLSFDLEGGNYPYWKKACAQVRQMDPSRLISSADSGHRFTLKSAWSPDQADAFDTNVHNDQWRPGHPDEFYELLDVLSGNVYVSNPGDGLVAYHKFAEMLRPYNKPLIISEFGSMSLRGADKPQGRLGTEDRHCTILQEAYQSFAQLPEIAGNTPWCLVDVRVPMHWRWYNAGRAVFRYGLLDENWQKKKAFDTVKEGIAMLKKKMGQ